jgi:hypothetical protein
MYDNLKSAKERGLGIDVCLDGPIFNGKYQTDSVIYGDTDSVHGSTLVDIAGETKSISEHFTELSEGNVVLKLPNDVELLLLNGLYDTPCIVDDGWDYMPANLIYRHKSTKRRFKITTSSGKTIVVTEDHSLIVVGANGELQNKSPLQLTTGDMVIEQTGVSP